MQRLCFRVILLHNSEEMRVNGLRLLLMFCFAICLAAPSGAEEARVLTLDEAIATALGENPGMTAAEASVEISESLVRSANSAYYPEIYTRLVFPFIGRESGFFLDQLIWDFGRTSSRVKSSKAQLRSTRFDGETAREDLILDTTVGYYSVLSWQHTVAARTKKVGEFEARLERAEGFYEAGRAGKADVTKAEVDLSGARLELNTAANELEAAKQGLLDAMGVDGGFNYTLVDDPAYDKIEMNIEKSIDAALDNRPELKSLKAREAAMDADLTAAQKEYFPVIFGRTAYRFKGEGAETPGFIAGIGLELNIFDGFKKNADIQNARAQLRRSRAELETKKTEVESEIRKLHRDLSLAEENISVTEDTRRSSEEALTLARERYRLERASDVELAEAEALYSNANAAYLEAIYNYRITAAKLERAVSGGGDLDQ